MATRLFMLNAAAAQFPSANSKSTVLPTGTFAVSAGGTANERLGAGLVAGTAQVAITFSSAAQTAQQSSYLARFTSAPLGAQAINTNTWTIGAAFSEANASANSFFAVSLYLWRPSTSALVGFIYNNAAALGTEWATAEQGVVATLTGAAQTAQTGDLLVLELWHEALQATAAVFSNSGFFNGTTAPVQATAASSAASYFETPQNLTFQTYAPLGARVFALPIKERDDG